MKTRALIAAVACATGCSAFAASDYVDTADVIAARPRIERITESRQDCDPAPAQRKDSSSVIAPIIGGVAGGLIGHQVGQGRGQTAATIIGAAGGAVAGSAVAERNNQNARAPQQCRTVETTREVVNGYDVTYRYNGRDVSVVLPYDPGRTIRVGISVIADQAPPPPDRRVDSGRRNDYNNPPPQAGGNNYQYRY